MTFSGYSKDALEFLRDLPSRDPDWFKSNRKDYESLIVGPTKALVSDLGDRLREDLPDIVAEPKTNGSIGPINNDLRFSPDKSPYKDHLLLRFWEGSPKKTASTLFLRIAPDGIGIAVGIVPADVGRWREAVDSVKSGPQLDSAIRKLATSKRGDVVGQELKKVPAPYPADHPRADLLRHKMIQVRWLKELPASIAKPGFVGWAAKQLEPCMPLHRTLVDAFQ